MAKAREIPGLRADMTFATAAAATVRVRAQELIDHGDGVLDTSDIERVHAMRVASRRLRAVLEIHAACFPKAEFRPVLRDVKALADALGARRDPDVQLASIAEFARALGEGERSGIEAFERELREDQARGNETLAAALQEIERTDLIGRLLALADSTDHADSDHGTVDVEPVEVEPVEVEPVDVEPVEIERPAVGPVAVEPVAVVEEAR